MDESVSEAGQDLEILKAMVNTALALRSQLQTPATPTPPAPDTIRTVNALDLAYDATSLIRAHSTKISLLLINNPFTPAAITTVLRELISGPLPGLASAVELCNEDTYTRAMHEELKYHAGRVFMEFGTLVEAIPLDGKILSDDAKSGTGSATGKGSLAITGTLWQACDAVIGLQKLGIAGFVIRKAEQYRATLEDALGELQEWAEEESDEEGDGDRGDTGSGDEDDAQAAVDNMFRDQQHIPSDDPEKIRPRLDSSLKRLRLLGLMYRAVVKRRFKILPKLPVPWSTEEKGTQADGTPRVVACLDEILDMMKRIPDSVDELASAFYELDGKDIDERMNECFFNGFKALQVLGKNWKGEEDEFTTWVQKFQLAMKKPI